VSQNYDFFVRIICVPVPFLKAFRLSNKTECNIEHEIQYYIHITAPLRSTSKIGTAKNAYKYHDILSSIYAISLTMSK